MGWLGYSGDAAHDELSLPRGRADRESEAIDGVIATELAGASAVLCCIAVAASGPGPAAELFSRHTMPDRPDKCPVDQHILAILTPRDIGVNDQPSQERRRT